ncbi:MAG: cysteine--tRNA ligase [Patescibacteria group bacterium]
MWPFSKWRTLFAPAPVSTAKLPLYLHNTLSGKDEQFTLPPAAHTVRMYNCGPTVYGRQHIGNLSMFVFTDVLKRALEYNDFKVKQVINITDVGHLTSDADEGEDKMSKGLKSEKMKFTLKNMRALGEKYTATFLDDLRSLNIDTARIEFPRASDYIPAQIAMIHALMDKSYAYTAEGGVYFDTAHFPRYGELGGIDIKGLREGARVTAVAGKRSPTDFVLWKFDKKIGWESPWGQGFPGWHIECSAMIRKTLGEQIDIHTGGIEHIPVHHNNEIAQSEGAIGKRPLSRFWLHRAHIQFQGGKLAKSAGNVVYLSDVIERGFHSLALRYLFLGAHYRTNANFSWEALQASSTALSRLAQYAQEEGGAVAETYRARFHERINDDLDTPGALAVLWDVTKDSSLSSADISATVRDADRVLGLGLGTVEALNVPVADTVRVDDLSAEVALLVAQREEARTGKDWTRADELRDQIAEAGYDIKDTPTGPTITKV